MDQTFETRESEQSEKEQTMQVVGFIIGKETFGVDILMVQEIIRSAPITVVPNSPDFIEGVINLRGSIIPVIDLRKRLNLQKKEAKDSKNWILIINVEERVTGFLVDAVTKVMKIPIDSIEPPPDIVMAGLHSQYIRGVCEIEDNRLLILLDFSRILQFKEVKKLRDFDKT